MKKIFSFTKKKKHPSGTPDSGSVLSLGYDLKEKDLGKVHKAALVGDLSKLKQLAKKNDLNQLDKENRTALHIACASGHVEVVQFLVETKAKLNLCDNQNRSALMKAVQGQHERCVSVLLENHADPNLVDINGNTALHLAANIPCISITILLLQHEGNINAQNKEGFTPLIVAVREDHIEMAEFLLKETAGVNVMDQDQRSPLMIAAGNGQIGMLRLLLRFNADITQKDTKGWSADDYAVMNGHHPCSLLIIEHGTQRNDGPSLSHQGPSRKKKKMLSGSPFQDVEAGFSLGGPATDKDDFEDNSQSESLSRVSKSATDEWSSSEDDDDDLVSNKKKPLKVNLRKMIASKKGQASALLRRSFSGSDSEPESESRVQRIPSLHQTLPSSKAPQQLVDPAPISFLPKAPQMTSTPLPSYRKEGEEDEEEDEDEEDEEESEEEDGEEEDENECEEEEDGNNVASAEANTPEYKDSQTPSATAALKITNSPDNQNLHVTANSLNGDTTPCDVDASEGGDLLCSAGTTSFAIPTTLDVADDCVVSAVRVESKFSDEDDSLGKELILPSPSTAIKEEFEEEAEKEDDDSRSNNQNSGEMVWNDSDDDEEDNRTGGLGRNKALALRKPLFAEVGAGKRNTVSDAEEGAGSNDLLNGEKRRSSWGSSIEDSDADLPEEKELQEEALDPKRDVQESDLQPEAAPLHEKGTLPPPNDDHSCVSWDSPSPSSKCASPKQMMEKPKSSSGPSPTSSPQHKNKAGKTRLEGSGWDSSPERKENDEASFADMKAVSPVSQRNVMKQHFSGDPHKEDNGICEKKSDHPSPTVSPGPDEENAAINQMLEDANDVNVVGQSSQMEDKVGPENEESDDSRWDDEDESDESGTQKPVRKKDDEGSNCGEDEEEVGPSAIEGKGEPTEENLLEGEKRPQVARGHSSKDGESSEDSDSRGQKVQWDFASAKVSAAGDHSGDGDDKPDGEPEASLTAYVSLENKSAIVPPTSFSPHDLGEEENKDKPNEAAGQRHRSEELPQTDIDSVELDSPDEAESVGMRGPQLRNAEEPVPQKEDSTENEEFDDNDDDDDEERDDEEEEEEEEGDLSDENDRPAESGESLDATSTVPETDVSRDKKRDFLSELGLEKEEEEPESWGSESHSENLNLPQEKQSLHTQDREELCAAEEATKETENDNNGRGNAKDDIPQKETEKAKWEPLSVLSKLEGEKDRKTDLMEELGLGDVDDLEDASDWDSASTTSKRTLPGRKMASPGLDEFPKEEDSPATPLTPQRTFDSDMKRPTASPRLLPHPQPRARKTVPQKPESEGESDWEPDNLSSASNPAKIDNQPNIAELQAADKPGSPDLSSMAGDSQRNDEHDETQHKEKDDAGDKCELDQNSPRPSGCVGSVRGEKVNDFRDERGEDGPGVPWEKRYEKLWVEVEKRDVKSTFKNVAGELKEKFGELLKSRCSEDDDEEAAAESSSSSEDESSDEEGEIIVRPTARARSTVLVTIPEQRESGLEDSLTESTDNSLCDDRMRLSQPEPGPPTDGVLKKSRSPSPQPTTARTERNTDQAATACSTAVDSSSFLKDRTKRGPLPHPQIQDFVLKDPTAETLNGRSEEDPEEGTESRRPLPIPGVSDEELEEDMGRLKLQVGMLKVGSLDLEKGKAQLQKEVSKDKTSMEVQKSHASLETGGKTLGELGTVKPETRLGSLSSHPGEIRPPQQLTAAKSTNRAPAQSHLRLQQRLNSSKVEENSKLEVVRGARCSRAPQTNAHVNGDPLSVFDDSTLSDVSDDEGRLPSSGQQRNEMPGDMELAEDFDELTQSSDTATDDIDSPTSGYRHASLLIQKLDSATLDSSMVKLQNIFHEYERSIQKSRSRHGYLADKVSQLEGERAELKSSLEEVKDFKSALERNQLELQTEVTNLKFQLKQEQENRSNATMMYNSTRDKLRRTEEHHQFEVQERQKVELTLRNLELEMRTLINNMKQLEEDHSETQRLLAQERSARTLQENLLSKHLRKQQEIEEENQRNIGKSHEALSQLTEASDRERELLQQTSTLQEQLTILRTDLERSQANSSLRESHILEENDALKEQLEDARRDLKLNGEALTQTVFTCNNQVTALKSELAVTTTRLENERQSRETLEVEVESTRTRLAGAVKEAERCQGAHADAEKALLREKEEHRRLKDRLTGEAASQRETVSSLSQKLAKAEASVNSMENEVHRVTLQLTEKGLLLDVLQREKDQAAGRAKELESALQGEKELMGRAKARQEASQERLAQTQSEGMLLRQQLEEAQNKGVAKERAVTDAQERFSDILSQLRSDCEERVQLIEERNKELATKAADLRDQIYKLEEEKNDRETNLRQLQQELADSLKKLSMSEASLEVNTRYRNDLEEEKARLLKDMDRLRGKLEESEDNNVQAERRINSVKCSLDEKEKELSTAAQKLQEALSASAASHTTIKQLEEAMQRLEIENARLEVAAKQQSNRIDTLQKGAQEAAMVRGRLEDLVTNLQSSKMTLEDQLNREVQKQSVMSHTAQDSQALWEEELKSRSKLGLRLAELEKEKGELNSQMEIEKKKAKKITEQKKAVDARLDQEMKRNTDLQKEMYRLRTLLKTAKKKMRDQDTGGAEFGSPMSSLRLDLGRHTQAEGGFGRMKEKVDDLQVQLEKEESRSSQLEKVNRELKDQLSSSKSFGHGSDQLERSKRQLEEEVLDLRRRMEVAQMEQSQVEHYRRDTEERARQEIQQKLEQVNLFLQSQAASQDALDQIKAANEVNLRSQLEQKIRELEGEMSRVRSTQQESLNQRDSSRTELERFRQLYAEELRLRKSLAAKLERSNTRLTEANSKLLNERSRSLLSSSIANGSLGSPSLDVGTLGSPANYGVALGPLNRSLGLSLLSTGTEGHNSRVEDYLAKMQSELDRNISKELHNATAELDAASVRMSPVGSVSRVELDPVSRATQQYLEVLKKNNMI